MKPYDHQEKLIRGLGQEFVLGRRKVCGQLATGGGKTVIFSAIANRFLQKNPKKRVLITVHRIELLKQTRKTLYKAFGIEAVAIKAGMKYIPDAPVYVGMVESVNRRISKILDIGLLIVDECHIASFNKLHEKFENSLILGFSATPLSSNKRFPVKMFYESIVCGISIAELIKQKFLCQNMTWAPKETVDRLELQAHMKGDDFDDIYMGETFSKPKYIQNTVSAYERWGKGKKTLIFNVNVDHSKEVNKAFIEAGYDSRHLDGNTPAGERAAILKWFKETPDAILNNVGIATVGFDEPGIEVVIVNKATTSMPLWLQMCGRGSRIIEGLKYLFTIIDMGGNAITHGDWSQERDWTNIFNNPPRSSENNEGIAPVKSCPNCEAIIPASAKVCQYCGFEYDAKSIPVEIALRDFIMVTKGIDVDQVMKENENRKEYYSFFEIGRNLVIEFQKKHTTLTNEFANFILQIYQEKGREWLKKYNEKKGLHKKYNQWHQITAREYLFSEFKKYFPQWQSPPSK